MEATASLTFEIARRTWHFEAIHRLNYKTFVEEIPQHERNPAHRLVDRFHAENTYIIALRGRKLLGMVSLRDRRPFSLDAKIANLDDYLPRCRSLCEIRLLAVEPQARSGRIFYGLMRKLYEHCRDKGHDLAVISGTTRQLKLYKHLGFVPFGSPVGGDGARFQPMYLTREAIELRWGRKLQEAQSGMAHEPPANFLPGPVALKEGVRRRFAERPVSHRSESFVTDFQSTRKLLRAAVHAPHVEILMGSGTLANDAIAAQLSLSRDTGMILSNGEFGERLIDHATRFGLSFEGLRVDWGQRLSREQIQNAIDRRPAIRWLWAVHCETSTGVLNDLEMLKQICAENRLRLSMDCISSIGAVPVDLRGVDLASAVSGKGLGGFPGLSMVFHERDLPPAPERLPRYLDLGYYAAADGIPFTLSSNLLYALRAALGHLNRRNFARVADLAARLRAEIRNMGLPVVGDDSILSPAVTTVALPTSLSSEKLGKTLEDRGHLVSYRSGYLLERNWLQICLMGEVAAPKLRLMIEALRRSIEETPLSKRVSTLPLAQAS
jgi:aspartate aminotransferase-like enzyme/GNAT superfamily N-acetyltransferase